MKKMVNKVCVGLYGCKRNGKMNTITEPLSMAFSLVTGLWHTDMGFLQYSEK